MTTDSSVASSDGNVSVSEVSRTATTMTYQVGKAGTVMIDVSGGQIVVTSVVPNAGWTAEPARTNGVGSAKVHFVSGSTRLEFVATMSNGAPSVSVVADNSPLPGSGPGISSTKPTMPGSSVGDDDEDDDEHEDEHEDDDHEDEDGPEFEHEDDD